MLKLNKIIIKISDNGLYLLPTNELVKKENTKRLKHFLAGYVGKFYRNIADNVDNFLGSDFYSRISKDYDIHNDDLKRYILATSGFAKSVQADINHYVTRDRINDASFREKLDPISKKYYTKAEEPYGVIFRAHINF